jgi:heat shock protein HtpX
LASALQKLEQTVARVPPPATLPQSEAHLFIMNPLAGTRGRGMASLFSTHPPTPERVARLEAIAAELRGGSPIG